MKGYSRSRQDFIDLLCKKYVMKEAIFIEGESCSKCHIMKPHCRKWAEENGYDFQIFGFSDVAVKEFKIESVPMLVLKEDGEVKNILNEEGIVDLISNSNNNG